MGYHLSYPCGLLFFGEALSAHHVSSTSVVIISYSIQTPALIHEFHKYLSHIFNLLSVFLGSEDTADKNLGPSGAYILAMSCRQHIMNKINMGIQSVFDSYIYREKSRKRRGESTRGEAATYIRGSGRLPGKGPRGIAGGGGKCAWGAGGRARL